MGLGNAPVTATDPAMDETATEVVGGGVVTTHGLVPCVTVTVDGHPLTQFTGAGDAVVQGIGVGKDPVTASDPFVTFTLQAEAAHVTGSGEAAVHGIGVGSKSVTCTGTVNDAAILTGKGVASITGCVSTAPSGAPAGVEVGETIVPLPPPPEQPRTQFTGNVVAAMTGSGVFSRVTPVPAGEVAPVHSSV